MGRVSKSRLREKTLEEIAQHFFYLISSLTNSQEVENFLDGFFTKEEKIMLTKRLVLLMMIKRNYSPSTIQSTLRVSYETVRSYTNQLPLKNSLFHKTIDRLIGREKAQEFWKKIDQILKPLELALNAKTDMKARAKLATGVWS